jgi:hypothetical protein
MCFRFNDNALRHYCTRFKKGPKMPKNGFLNDYPIPFWEDNESIRIKVGRHLLNQAI